MRVHSLGHVVLKVRNLERSVPFYRDVLGLKQVGQHGEKMVFFSIVDNHHDLALLETDNLAVSSLEESPGLHHSTTVSRGISSYDSMAFVYIFALPYVSKKNRFKAGTNRRLRPEALPFLI